jgi:hypothetical protein
VPGNLKEVFSKLKFAETISSRINEVPEVARMTKGEADELLERGFKILRLRFADANSRVRTLRRLSWVSDRNADQLQELGLRVATAAKENEGIIEDVLVDEIVNVWIQMQHAVACSAVEASMSPADTMYGRRNQVLYCIGLIESDEFGIVDLKRLVAKTFGAKAAWIESGFDGVFTKMCEGFEGILRPNSHVGSFQVRKAVYRMAIRAMLKLEDGGAVVKVGRSI